MFLLQGNISIFINILVHWISQKKIHIYVTNSTKKTNWLGLVRVESYNVWPWVKLFGAIISTLNIHFHLSVHALTLLRLSGKSFWTELRNYRSFHQTQKLRKLSDSIWNLSQRFASLAIKRPHVSIKTCGDLGHLLVLNYKKFIKEQKLKTISYLVHFKTNEITWNKEARCPNNMKHSQWVTPQAASNQCRIQAWGFAQF